jgi:7,8-dihydropterin-6-yl-methyl-4-(beta-D-ribofuranosyl)aminobenzene 5'-phosphate synthase
MKLSVLTENVASGYFTAEFGLSYFIEQDNKTILFDTGHSDNYLRNAKRLNIDIDKAETVVLSHGHWDHGNGLKYIKDKKLICHPNVFIKRYRRGGNIHNGLDLSYNELNDRFQIITSKDPYYISEKIIFLGEIPRLNSFESQTTPFIDENGNDDFIVDDSALAIIDDDKLIVVTGCSHSGICNIVEYAKKVTGLDTIRVVIGGFHLALNDDQTKQTINYFKKQKVEYLLPSHCTKLPALSAFNDEFKINQVTAGIVFYF